VVGGGGGSEEGLSEILTSYSFKTSVDLDRMADESPGAPERFRKNDALDRTDHRGVEGSKSWR